MFGKHFDLNESSLSIVEEMLLRESALPLSAVWKEPDSAFPSQRTS